MLLDDSLEKRLWSAFCLHANGSKSCEKLEWIILLRLLNDTCNAFGDRKLQDVQIFDLVDSLYTQYGEIDGKIDYEDFYNLLLQHPIMELFVSIQFQGQDNYLPIDLKLKRFFENEIN